MTTVYHPEGPTFFELMRQALVSTERGYDLIAPKFDYTPFRTPEPVLDAMMAAIRDDRSGTELRAGLDVCCGTGAALRHLRATCKERVVGLDFSHGMLDEARRRLEDAPGEAKIELVHGDALALPFENEFDIVTSVGAFGHILPASSPASRARSVAAVASCSRRARCPRSRRHGGGWRARSTA